MDPLCIKGTLPHLTQYPLELALRLQLKQDFNHRHRHQTTEYGIPYLPLDLHSLESILLFIFKKDIRKRYLIDKDAPIPPATAYHNETATVYSFSQISGPNQMPFIFVCTHIDNVPLRVEDTFKRAMQSDYKILFEYLSSMDPYIALDTSTYIYTNSLHRNSFHTIAATYLFFRKGSNGKNYSSESFDK